MNTSCSLELLESALAGTLPTDDEKSLYQHLEECDACSASLERLAGGTDWSSQAASLLKTDELDAAIPSREEWSPIDFTVEHLEPTDEPNVLGRLGGYDVLEIIGHGGMGVVLKAFDRQLKRCVAIKVLAPHLAQSSLARKRFAREAQAAAAVVHPNVLAIHQVQPTGRLPFLVMPLIAGESLAQRLSAQGTLELKEILRIGIQAAAGLGAAHEQGLVHRDVKPANILLEKGIERAVLTDFGLARAADDVTLTRWGVIAGTPQYMSPEQARGEPLDCRSDLFSLGSVLYEMATGVSPFRTDSMLATLRRLVDDAPQAMASLNPELPPWFIAIVNRLLEKDPAKRFSTAKEVSELLEGCLAHMQQPASVPLPASLPVSTKSRIGWRKFIFSTKGVLAMMAAIGIGLLGVLLASSEPPDISGEWSGDEWGRVVLKKTTDGEYTGTFSDTVGKQPGEIQLKWSRIERRFNGTWSEGKDRLGEISVRVVSNDIRGAFTADVKSKINPATPRLADFTWHRVGTNTGTATPPIEQHKGDIFETVVEREIPFHRACLNLTTGKLTPMAELPLAAEARKLHGDIFQPATENDLNALTILDVRLLELDSKAWTDLSATALEEKFTQQAADHKTSQPRSETRIPPGVYGFKTFDKTGLLQVRELEKPIGLTGVKIGYKLLQDTAKKDATSEPNSPSSPPDSRLQFRLSAAQDIQNGENLTSRDGKEQFRLRREVLLDESAVVDAKVSRDGFAPTILVTFSAEGSKRFAEITRANIGQQLGIVFDGKVLSAPIIRSAIANGQAQIVGSFTPAEAEAIAKILAPSDDAVEKPVVPKDPPESVKTANPLHEIELKVAQQQMEKILNELQDLQTEIALWPSKTGLTEADQKAEIAKLELKQNVLREQAARLRETILRSMRSQ